jgi:hypothetical protein
VGAIVGEAHAHQIAGLEAVGERLRPLRVAGLEAEVDEPFPVGGGSGGGGGAFTFLRQLLPCRSAPAWARRICGDTSADVEVQLADLRIGLGAGRVLLEAQDDPLDDLGALEELGIGSVPAGGAGCRAPCR